MPRMLLSVAFVVLLAATSLGQDTTNVLDNGWDLGATFNLTHNQAAYSDNWDGDEEGQIAWTSQLNMIAQKQLSEILNSRSTLDLQYGQTQTQDGETEEFSRPAKSADKAEFESVLRFTLDGWLDPYVSARILSQFTDRRGGGDIIWLNPVTYTESVGIAKTLWGDENQLREWVVRLGGAMQQEVDRNYLLNEMTGERGEYSSNAAGIELVSEMITPLFNANVKMDSKLIIFQALYNSKADELKGQENEDYWQSPDIDLETIFTANITKVLMVNLTTRLLYDKEISKGGRFKETLALGITYVLF